MENHLPAFLIFVSIVTNTKGFNDCPFKCTCTGTRLLCDDLQENFPYNLPAATTELRITNSVINNIKAEVFQPMRNLELFSAELTDITFIHPCAFANLPNLQEIRITKSYIYRIVKNGFSYLKNVKYIVIDHTNITTVSQFAFNDIEDMDWLNITQARIDQVETSAFTNLTDVKNILLKKNVVKHIKPRPFQNIKNVGKFVISQNNFQSRVCGMIDVISSQGIGQLEFVDNNVVCDCDLTSLSTINSGSITARNNICLKPANVRGMVLSSVTRDTLCVQNDTDNVCDIRPIKAVHSCNTYTYDEPIIPQQPVEYPSESNTNKNKAAGMTSASLVLISVVCLLYILCEDSI